jgi:hypothetical protein
MNPVSMTGGSVETTGTAGEAILVSGLGRKLGTFYGISVRVTMARAFWPRESLCRI